jgi:hypothetical protein
MEEQSRLSYVRRQSSAASSLTSGLGLLARLYLRLGGTIAVKQDAMCAQVADQGAEVVGDLIVV